MAHIAMAMDRTFLTQAVRWLFSWIDWVFYHIASFLMQAVFDIAEFSFSQDIFDEVISRVYLILGIFMLFKITISLISYLVNPDQMTDKSKGMGNLVTRVIVVMVMLIMLPTAFQFLTRLQGPLLETLPRVILGVSIDDDGNSAIIQDKGSQISWNVFSAFFYNNPDCVGYSSGNDEVLRVNFGDTVSDPLHEAVTNINNSCQDNGSMYQYEYTPIISTIAGGFICYTLLGVCIMVAIRMFKLIILQMIAPIPVISYIDPKSSKDGTFNTWLKTLITTWLEVFIILGIMYLIVFIIDELLISGTGEFASHVTQLGWRRGAFFTVFVILGLFMFASKAPKFIMDALGIKGKGTFAQTLGLANTALRAPGTLAANYRAGKLSDEARGKTPNLLRNIKNAGTSLFGSLATMGAAGDAVLSNDKNAIKAGSDILAKRNAMALSRGAAGSTAIGRSIASMQNIMFGETSYDKMNKQKASLETANKNTVTYKNTLEKKALEKDNLFIDYNGHKLNWLEYIANLDGAKNGNEASLQWMIDHGFSKTETVTETIMEEETYTEYEESGGEWVPVKKTKKVPRTVTTTKTVADWQSAQVQQDKIKDTVTQTHAANLMAAVEAYEKSNGKDRTVFEKFGAEYNDYRNAKDANEDAGFRNVDYVHYGNADGTGIKQTLGKQNEKITDISTSTKYQGAKANADAAKKGS